MNDMNLPELPDDPIRKALKKLPPVKAAPDFEARLKRRLLEPAQEAGVAWRIFSGARRVPAFAFSLVALIAVGYFSYYIFWRTAVGPPPVEEPRVPSMYRAVPPAPPLLKQGEEPGAKDQPQEPAQTEDKRATQTEPKGSPRAGMEKRAAGERGRSAAPSQAESKTGPAPAKNEEARGDETASGAAAASAPEATQVTSDIKIQQREENKPAVESQVESKARRLATPTAPAPMYRMESRGMVSIPLIDSAAIRDSLRLDSLKRAEKIRLELQKRAKAKKRGH